jgi:DNA-binding transcriptional MocR family regulator
MPIEFSMFRSVPPRRPRPSLYGEIAATIRRQVEDGLLRPGDRLPSEKDMRHEYGVGNDTVRDALAVLRNEGLIVSEQGQRHQVRVPPRRELVWLRPGERALARMPTPDERDDHDIAFGIPVFVVGGVLYPADRFELASRRPRRTNRLQE